MAKKLGSYQKVVSGLKPHLVGNIRTSLRGVTEDGVNVRASFGAIPEGLDEDTVVAEMARQEEVGVQMARVDKTGGTLSLVCTGQGVAIQFGHEPTAAQRSKAGKKGDTASPKATNGAGSTIGSDKPAEVAATAS